jgi:hypothetical protein
MESRESRELWGKQRPDYKIKSIAGRGVRLQGLCWGEVGEETRWGGNRTQKLQNKTKNKNKINIRLTSGTAQRPAHKETVETDQPKIAAD